MKIKSVFKKVLETSFGICVVILMYVGQYVGAGVYTVKRKLKHRFI